MTPSNLRLSVAILISILLFPQSASLIKGCGGWDPDDVIDTSMFIPQMTKNKRFDPFFLSIENYYTSDYHYTETGRPEIQGKSLKEYNIDEWSAFFQGFIDTEQLDKIVYRLDLNSMDSLSNSVDKQLSTLPTTSKLNEAGKLVKSGIQYLRFAKHIEKAVYVNPWSWNPEPPDNTLIISYKNQAIASYKANQNTALKMRYAFQYLRLCYVSGSYQEGIQFIQTSYPYKPEQGMMYFRTLGYAAACHVKLREFSAANIIYARLYDLGEAFKFEAFESFHPQGPEDWSRTLDLTKTRREKEVLWHLFGVYVDPLKGMKEIAILDPNSDLLPLLLVRAVQIAETNSIENYSFRDYSDMFDAGNRELETFTPDPLYSWNSIFKEQIAQLNQEIQSIAPKRKSDQGIWLMSSAFLYWLDHDLANCSKYSALAAAEANGNSYILTQHAINNLLIGFNETNRLDEATELKLMDLIQGLNHQGEHVSADENAIRFVLRGLRDLYLAQGDELMAELSEPQIHSFYSSASKIQGMIDFMLDPKKNSFRAYLIGRYPITLDDLYDVQATALLYQYDFEGALSIYSKHPKTGTTELLGNPFNYRKVDCHDCDHVLPQKVKYNKRSFAAKMLELKAKGDDLNMAKEERSTNYFLFANGLYNMTYYGNARMVSVTAVDWEVASQMRTKPEDETVLSENPYHDCSAAETYYLKAKVLSSSREMQAKCLWMAAKCEHNIWLETKYTDETGDFVAGNYYRLLQKEFIDTKYYGEIIQECGYFCQFNYPGEPSCIKTKD